jgi:hypothetical protein
VPQDPEAQVFEVPDFYAPVHQIYVGPDPLPYALAKVELGEPEKTCRVFTVVVFMCLPTTSGIQNQASGI